MEHLDWVLRVETGAGGGEEGVLLQESVVGRVGGFGGERRVGGVDSWWDGVRAGAEAGGHHFGGCGRSRMTKQDGDEDEDGDDDNDEQDEGEERRVEESRGE